jgi:hypothetical protein
MILLRIGSRHHAGMHGWMAIQPHRADTMMLGRTQALLFSINLALFNILK